MGHSKRRTNKDHISESDSMDLTKAEIRLMRKPPAKFVGRDERAADELVRKGAYRRAAPNQYVLTKAGSQALDAADPKKQ